MPQSRLFIPFVLTISLAYVSPGKAQVPTESTQAGEDSIEAKSDSLLVIINELETRLRELGMQYRARESITGLREAHTEKAYSDKLLLHTGDERISLYDNFRKRYTVPKSGDPLAGSTTARGYQHIPPGQSTATGISRAFNPAMSVNGLFSGGIFNGRRDQPWEVYPECGMEEGLHMQETEIQFSSFVSPFFKADIIASFSADDIMLEEVFITSAALPFGWKARIGKIYAPLGKHNALHLHHFPFIEAPLIHTMLLTEGGLADFGAELSYLFPLPFYLEATGGVFNGDHPFFDTGGGRDIMGLGRMNALWDLSENTTLELGGSFVTGKSGLSDGNESVIGADTTIKWRPLRRALYTQAEWQLEYLKGSQYLKWGPFRGSGEELGGIVTHLRYRFNRTWWVQARYDKTGLPGGEDVSLSRYTAQLAFVPDEFELWRLQYSLTDPDVGEPFGMLTFQINFTIGSHPAHVY